MDITGFFIHYRKAGQYIYAGENYLEIYRSVDKVFKKIRIFDETSITDLDSFGIEAIKREMLDIDTGIILNSGLFIFNIFEFEKIPFKESLRSDLVNWRLQKVFPEDIALYEHRYFKLDKTRILSVLFKKELKEKLESLVVESGIKLIYMGNSTVETLNNIDKLKPSPDFFLEVDGNLCVLVFCNKSVPYYIRKFRTDKEGEVADEILRTLNYVKNSYSNDPKTYSIISNSGRLTFDKARAELTTQGIRELAVDRNKIFLLPG